MNKAPTPNPTFRRVLIDTAVFTGSLGTAILLLKEFWQPADWFVTWVKSEIYLAPGLVLMIAVCVTVRHAFEAAQLAEFESKRQNPVGNRHQRRAQMSQQRRSGNVR